MFSVNNSMGLAVGKSQTTAFVPSTTIGALAVGEIAFVKNDGTLLAAGDTFATSKTIKLIQKRIAGSGQDFLFGATINGLFVTKYKKTSFVAPTEQASTATVAAGTVATVATAPLKLRIIFKGDKTFYAERSEVRNYNYVPVSSDTNITIANAFVALVNADKAANKQVIASTTGAGDIKITALPLIFTLGYFRYNKVQFDLVTNSNWSIAPTTVLNTISNKGNGTYEEIAELEYFISGSDGAQNKQIWPVQTGRADATLGKTYDTCAIEFFNRADTNKPVSGAKDSRALLYLAFELPGAGFDSQSTVVYAKLDPWMASLPNKP